MPYTGPEYAQSFLAHRLALLDLLEQIPPEKGNFAAWEGGMSFVNLVDHLVGSSGRMVAMMAGQKPGPVEPSPDLASAVARMRQNAEEFKTLLEGLSEEQLARVVPAFGGMQIPVSRMVDMTREHEAHHKGQIWMMARMIGVQPPMFARMNR